MKRGTPDHPKMKALARALDIPIAYANGILERLWHFTAEYSPDGSIGKYSNQDIAVECGFDGDADVLIDTLSSEACQWLDTDPLSRLIVHDWHEHCEDSVHCKLARAKKFFANGQPPKLSRLPRDEKATAEAWYAQNTFQSVRQALESARQARESAPTHKSTQLASALALALAKPEPLPSHAHASGARAPVAADLNGQTSARFEEWFGAVWAPARGNAYRDAACMAYMSVVSVELEEDAFACTRSYVSGPGFDPSHGYRPDNFLFQMARDQFKTRWPARRVEKSKSELQSEEWRNLNL